MLIDNDGINFFRACTKRRAHNHVAVSFNDYVCCLAIGAPARDENLFHQSSYGCSDIRYKD